MSVTATVELSNELRRLAVAGVALAKGDRRIAALVPALEKSGGKAPVFARIAERTNALLMASKADAPAEFLQLNTLVGAVLKTQARSDVDGVLVPSPPSVTTAKRIPMRALDELHEGLYGGRTETLNDAIERGWFGDARLAPFALDALSSENAVLANFSAKKILPHYGKAIVPQLVATLDVTSKRPAARIIEAIGRIDSASGVALARQILDPTAEKVFDLVVDEKTISDQSVLAVLSLLGENAIDRTVLLDFLEAKKKSFRVTALARLLSLGDADAEAHAVAMFEKSEQKVRELMDAVEASPVLTEKMLTEIVVPRGRDLAETKREEALPRGHLDEVVRTVSMMVRAEPTTERFDTVLSMLECVDTEWRSVSSNLRHDVTEYLVDACPPFRRDSLARFLMMIEPNGTALAAARRYGLDGALAFIAVSDKGNLEAGLVSLLSEQLREFLTGLPESLPQPLERSSYRFTRALEDTILHLADCLLAADHGAVDREFPVGRVMHEAKMLSALKHFRTTSVETVPPLSAVEVAQSISMIAKYSVSVTVVEPKGETDWTDAYGSTARNDVLVASMSLLVRLQPEPVHVQIVGDFFRRCDPLNESTSGFDDTTRSRLIDYLMVNAAKSDRDEYFLAIARWDVGYATVSAMGLFGLDEAVRLLRSVGKNEFIDGMYVVTEQVSGLSLDDDDSPQSWQIALLDFYLYQRQWEMIDRLWKIDPSCVVEAALRTQGISDGRLVVLALSVDPRCAGKLKGRLSRRWEEHESFDALCEAIVAGDPIRSDQIAEELSTDGDYARAPLLRRRLAEHFSETRS